MRPRHSTGSKGNRFANGPDAFRAFYFLRRAWAIRTGRLRKGIQTFIDFASLLCENPRKRPLLRG